MDGLRSIVCVLFAGLALVSSLGAGCTVSDGGADSYGDPYATGRDQRSFSDYEEDAPPPPPPQRVYEPAPVADERDRDEPLVPKTARLRTEGRGDLSFKGPRDGYVYVVDTREKKLVYEGPLDEGETLLIAPYRNVIEVDGVRVKRVKDLDNKHIHKIFFERDSSRGRGRDGRER